MVEEGSESYDLSALKMEKGTSQEIQARNQKRQENSVFPGASRKERNPIEQQDHSGLLSYTTLQVQCCFKALHL
jgi:hypothetical protein